MWWKWTFVDSKQTCQICQIWVKGPIYPWYWYMRCGCQNLYSQVKFCMKPAFQSCPQNCCSMRGSRVMAVQSFLHFWPVKCCPCLGWGLLEGGEWAFKPIKHCHCWAQCKRGGCGWLWQSQGSPTEARCGSREVGPAPGKAGCRRSSQSLNRYSSWTRRPRTLLLALVGIWPCGACMQLNFPHIRAIYDKFVYYQQSSVTTTFIPNYGSILGHFWSLSCWQICLLSMKVCFDEGMLWLRSASTKVCFDEGPLRRRPASPGM